MLRRRVAELRRDVIIDAAIDVFRKKGLKGSTMSDVASAAGVSTGTLYNYFDNKATLILAILHRLNETETRPTSLAPDADGHFEDVFAAQLEHRFSVMTQQLGVFPALFAEILTTPALRKRYLKEIVEPNFALARPRFAALLSSAKLRAVDADAAIRIISATVMGLLLLHAIGDPATRARWDRLPKSVADILMHGLLPEGKR
jgi:AcrR family transcriptional regulator